MNSLRKIVGPPKLLAAVSLFLGACSHGPELRDAHTAREQWLALHGPGERRIASTFYNLGTGDAIQKQYWALREVGGIPGPVVARRAPAALPAGDGLKHGRANVWVPGGTDADGTVREGHYEAIETVYLIAPAGPRKEVVR